MNVHERNRLTKAILAGDDLTAFRQRSLDCGLAALRQRSRRRLAVRMAALLASSSLLIYGFLLERKPSREAAKAAGPGPAIEEVAPTPATRPAVKLITDDELFALFPDRAMALIGNSGQQQVMFFGAPRQPEQIRSDSVAN